MYLAGEVFFRTHERFTIIVFARARPVHVDRSDWRNFFIQKRSDNRDGLLELDHLRRTTAACGSSRSCVRATFA